MSALNKVFEIAENYADSYELTLILVAKTEFTALRTELDYAHLKLASLQLKADSTERRYESAINITNTTLAQLQTSKQLLEEVKKDAARYQWLRNKGIERINWEGFTTETCDIGLDHAIEKTMENVK